MRIPRFWTAVEGKESNPRGAVIALRCLGWSDASVAEARTVGLEKLSRLAERVRTGADFPGRYLYADRPIREEILQELRDPAGDTEAFVTRNAYGAEVLNTARLMFADIDDPPSRASLAMAIKSLFGGKPAATGDTPEIPAAITAFAESNASWCFRVYRTKAGWRVIVTHDLFDPAADRTVQILQAFGSDPKYVQLTMAQKCFRARLTPKPWRCRLRLPARDFPREDASAQREHDDWVKTYDAASTNYATCRFVTTLGRGRDCDAARRMIELHDRTTRADTKLALA